LIGKKEEEKLTPPFGIYIYNHAIKKLVAVNKKLLLLAKRLDVIK